MVNNTKYGEDALENNTSGINNTAIGTYTAFNNLDGSNNTAIGSNSSYYTTSGSNNTALGSGSLCNNTTGSLNTAVGSSALEGLLPIGSVGNQNTAVGAQTLYINQGNQNTAIGIYAGLGVTGGNYNTFLGANSSTLNNVSYNYSTAIGYNATIKGSNEIMLGGLNSGIYPNVVIPGGITGATGSFSHLSASQQILAPRGITGATGSFGQTIITTNFGTSPTPSLTITDKSANHNMLFIPNDKSQNWNPAAVSGDQVIVAQHSPLTLTQQSSINSAVRITNNSVTMGVGGTGSSPTSSVQCNGTNVVISPLANYTSYNSASYNENTLVPKQYVDQFVSGIVVKEPATAIQMGSPIGGTYESSSVGSITGVNTPLEIDGIIIQDGSSVLLNSQTNSLHNGVYIWDSTTQTLTRRSGMQNNESVKAAYVFVSQGTNYKKTAWVQENDPAIVGINNLNFNEFSSFDYELGRGLDVINTGGLTTIDVDTSLNFINFLDSNTSVSGANGTLAIGTHTTSHIILGPTGGIPIQAQSIIQAEKGITGSTGSFSNLSSSNNSYLATTPGSMIGVGKTTAGFNLDINGTFRVESQNEGEFSVGDSNSNFNYPGFLIDNKGLKIFWNYPNGGRGRTTLLNNGQGGAGGFDFYECNVNQKTPVQATLTCGKLSVGTISPSYSLDVSGNFRVESPNAGEFSVGDSTSNFNYAGFSQYGYNKGLKVFWNYPNIGGGRTTFLNNGQGAGDIGGFDFYECNFENNTPVRATLTCGNLGIGGIENPSQSLDVSGNAKISGTITVNTLNTSSDYRIKEDINPLDDKFTIDSLIPVTYKNKHTKKQDIGLIAHEVQKIYPFLVNGDKDGEELQSINYTSLIALLIKEIKDLKLLVNTRK